MKHFLLKGSESEDEDNHSKKKRQRSESRSASERSSSAESGKILNLIKLRYKNDKGQ